MKELIGFLLLIAWITGIVFAHGFWSATFAITLPPYSFYLVIEHIVKNCNQ